MPEVNSRGWERKAEDRDGWLDEGRKRLSDVAAPSEGPRGEKKNAIHQSEDRLAVVTTYLWATALSEITSNGTSSICPTTSKTAEAICREHTDSVGSCPLIINAFAILMISKQIINSRAILIISDVIINSLGNFNYVKTNQQYIRRLY